MTNLFKVQNIICTQRPFCLSTQEVNRIVHHTSNAVQSVHHLLKSLYPQHLLSYTQPSPRTTPPQSFPPPIFPPNPSPPPLLFRPCPLPRSKSIISVKCIQSTFFLALSVKYLNQVKCRVSSPLPLKATTFCIAK